MIPYKKDRKKTGDEMTSEMRKVSEKDVGYKVK